MAQMTNLTDRLSQLRERKERSVVLGKPPRKPPPEPKGPGKAGTPRERRLRTDYLMIFAYSLLAVALVAQLALIVWLDVI